MWTKIYNRLPDNYIGLEQPNINKLHQIVYDELEQVETALKDIRSAHSIDDATGMTLDFIGGNVMQKRKPGESDESFRLMIKVKIISNLSQGSMGTINEVASTLFGDKFLGVRESWNLEEFNNEPAGLVLDLIPGLKDLPSDTIGRSVAGGVSILIILTLKQPQPDIYLGATTIGGDITTMVPYIETKGNIGMNSNFAIGVLGKDESLILPQYVDRLDSECGTYIAIGQNVGTEEVTVYPYFTKVLANEGITTRVAMGNDIDTEKVIIYPRKEVI